MNKRIYFDYNATTPLSPEVKEVYIRALDDYANGSSMHEDGRRVAKNIHGAREQIATLIGSNPTELIFTSGGSESNNMVINTLNSLALTKTASFKTKYADRKLVIVSAIEHPCVLESSKKLASQGFNVQYVAVDDKGRVNLDHYKELLQGHSSSDPQQRPLFVSIMMANNEIGTIQDIKELCSLAHKAGALFHTDAVQAVGKIPVNVVDLNVDYLTISGHKLYAPKGVGALYVKKGVPIETFIKGGHQENGLRAGTYNAPSIIAFGEACKRAAEELDAYIAHTRGLRDRLRLGLLDRIPNIHVNGHDQFVLSNTLNISFPGAEGESILLMLDILGVSVSTGSACASGSLEPSHVLMATGVGPELAHGSIRFSFGKYSTTEEIDFVIQEFPKIIEKLRGFSTVAG